MPIPIVAKRKSGKPVNETYRFQGIEYTLTVTDITNKSGNLEKQTILVHEFVPKSLQAELTEAIKRNPRYYNPQVVYPLS